MPACQPAHLMACFPFCPPARLCACLLSCPTTRLLSRPPACLPACRPFARVGVRAAGKKCNLFLLMRTCFCAGRSVSCAAHGGLGALFHIYIFSVLFSLGLTLLLSFLVLILFVGFRDGHAVITRDCVYTLCSCSSRSIGCEIHPRYSSFHPSCL